MSNTPLTQTSPSLADRDERYTAVLASKIRRLGQVRRIAWRLSLAAATAVALGLVEASRGPLTGVLDGPSMLVGSIAVGASLVALTGLLKAWR